MYLSIIYIIGNQYFCLTNLSFLSINLSIYPSTYLSIPLISYLISIYLFISYLTNFSFLSIYLLIYLTIYLSIKLYIATHYLHILKPINTSFYLSMYPISIYLMHLLFLPISLLHNTHR